MNAGGLPLTVWTWKKGKATGVRSTTDSKILISTPRVPERDGLRIISSHLDLLDTRARPYLVNFLQYHGVPPDFLLERQQGVNHSFGSLTSTTTAVSWAHFISKDVQIGHASNVKVATDPQYGGRIKNPFAWLHFTWILLQDFTPTTGMTLLLFDPTPQLVQQLDSLLEDQNWPRMLEDRYSLFPIIFESIWLTVDNVAWNLAAIFGDIEKNTLDEAGKTESDTNTIDFANLHNISKHTIYLDEASEAAQLLLTSVLEEHEGIKNSEYAYPSSFSSSVQAQLLRYRRLFKSTQMRIQSLDKRVANITNLSFNVVTQQDSRVMQRDSSSMHTIAIMTLVFLPSSLIATLFGSAFFSFSVSNDGSASASVSSFFWIFWVVAVPCTAIVLALWVMYNPTKLRLPHKGANTKM